MRQGAADDVRAVHRPVRRSRAGGRALVAWPLCGLATGAVWGVCARVWMRYVSPEPEFSWAGTAAILSLAAVAGASLALVEVLRRRGARLWRLVPATPAVLMFLSPGLAMLPTALLWGLALARGPMLVRCLATAAGAVPVAVVVRHQLVDLPNPVLPSVGGYLVLCLVLGWGWSAVWRRRVTR